MDCVAEGLNVARNALMLSTVCGGIIGLVNYLEEAKGREWYITAFSLRTHGTRARERRFRNLLFLNGEHVLFHVVFDSLGRRVCHLLVLTRAFVTGKGHRSFGQELILASSWLSAPFAVNF